MKLDQLSESRSTPVIVVDYQPAYDAYIRRHIHDDFMAFLNRQVGRMLIFYNGDQRTRDSLYDVQEYMIDHGLDKQKLEQMEFKEKAYGWLRLWMDVGVPPDIIIKVVRYMYMNHINDSRDISKKEYEKIIDYRDMVAWGEVLTGDDERVAKYMTDNIWIPDEISIAKLKSYNRSYMCGGGRHECLRELELMMNAFNIRYTRLERFIYQ